MKRFGMLVLAVVVMMVNLSGCVAMGSALLRGGKVTKNCAMPNVLIKYRAEGDYPKGASFYLVKNNKEQLEFYEIDPDGACMRIQKHWVEGDADFFSAAFFGYGPAYIYRIPQDRSKEGGRFVYPNGAYDGTRGDVWRPSPKVPKTNPDARLIPESM